MRICSLLTMLLTVPGLALAGNLVQDPGFENPTLSPWVSAGHPWGVDSANSHTGSNSAGTGCIGVNCIAADPDPFGAWIYQDLATTSTSYVLSFWVGLRGTTGGTTPNELRVLWDGVQVFDLQNLSNTPFQHYSVNVIATGSTTRLEFLGRNDPNVIDLDDVSVDETGSIPTPGVPEPSSWMLAGMGLAGVVGWRRRATC